MQTRILVGSFLGLALASSTFATSNSSVFTYSTDLSNYVVAPGQTANVKVYLVESNPTGSFLLDSELGAASAGVRGSHVPNPSPILAPVTPATILQFTPDAAFNDPVLTPLVTVGPAEFSSLAFADVFGAQGAPSVPLNATTEQLLLGELLIAAGPTPGDVTTFTLADFSSGSDTLSFLNNLVLDPQSTYSFSITVPIPEPTSLSILAFCAAPLLRGRRKTT